jgi:putative addiction module component (TIGR02574 family)
MRSRCLNNWYANNLINPVLLSKFGSIHHKMSTATIRERLFEYIRFADDKKVRAIYTMVEDDIIERLDLWEDKDFLKELDRRIEDVETGKVTGSTWEQVKAKSKA